MRPDVKPTRQNYLRIRKQLERTQEGYDLLEQKRQILVLELMRHVESSRRANENTRKTLAAAHQALGRAVIQSGITGLMRQSSGIAVDHGLSYRCRSVMGVLVPEVRCEPEPFGVQFGLSDGRSAADQVARLFLEALAHVAQLAQEETAVFRLAREIRRTQRRVHALEKTYIPRYKRELKYIEEALAERQREEFIVLRKMKHRRRAAVGEVR